MSFAFKKFQFLQNAEVPAHAWPRNATCSVPSPRHLYVGCDNGTVHVLDGSFQLFSTFQAHAFRVFYVGYLEVRDQGSACCSAHEHIAGHLSQPLLLRSPHAGAALARQCRQ